MTKEEADEKVREAERAVVDYCRQFAPLSGGGFGDLRERVKRLMAAEAARAALDKPVLLRPNAVFVEVDGKYWCVPELIEADRKHILAQAEKLPRHRVTLEHPGVGFLGGSGIGSEPAILLSDLRNLINGS